MSIFSRKKAEEAEELNGLVIARVSVEKVTRYENYVTAYLVERSSGDTVYKSEYKTIDPPLHAYYKAADDIKRHVDNEELIIDGDISTNIELPFVRTVQGKSGYAR